MTDKNSMGKIEEFFKIIGTYGVAIVFSSVLLGYFLAKDWKQGQAHVDALKNNTAAMKSIEMTVKDQAKILERQTISIEANTNAATKFTDIMNREPVPRGN